MAPWLFGLEHIRWKLALADGVPSPDLIALYHDVGLLVSMAVAVGIAALLTSPLWLALLILEERVLVWVGRDPLRTLPLACPDLQWRAESRAHGPLRNNRGRAHFAALRSGLRCGGCFLLPRRAAGVATEGPLSRPLARLIYDAILHHRSSCISGQRLRVGRPFLASRFRQSSPAGAPQHPRSSRGSLESVVQTVQDVFRTTTRASPASGRQPLMTSWSSCYPRSLSGHEEVIEMKALASGKVGNPVDEPSSHPRDSG